MIRALILAASLSSAFWWSRQPALRHAPMPPESRVQYRSHEVGGFRLSLGKKWLDLPPGTELVIPVYVAPPDTIPDWSKV